MPIVANLNTKFNDEKFEINLKAFINKSDVVEDFKISINGQVDSDVAKHIIGNELESIAALKDDIVSEFIIASFDKYKQENITPLLLNPNAQSTNIICRCIGLTVEDVNQLIDKSYGEFQQVLKTSMVSQVCGSCRSEVNQLCLDSDFAKNMIHGHSIQYWEEKISSEFVELHEHLPPDFENLNYEFISFKKDLLKIRVSGDRQNLKRPEIQTQLRHYLQGKLNIPLNVSIIF